MLATTSQHGIAERRKGVYFGDEPIRTLWSRTVCSRCSVSCHITRGDRHPEIY